MHVVKRSLALAAALIAVACSRAPDPDTPPSANPPEPPRRVSVSLTTTPSGATVSVDGKTIGPSPVKADFPAGRHQVEVKMEGYESLSAGIEIVPGGPAEFAFPLNPVAPPSLGNFSGTYEGSYTYNDNRTPVPFRIVILQEEADAERVQFAAWTTEPRTFGPDVPELTAKCRGSIYRSSSGLLINFSKIYDQVEQTAVHYRGMIDAEGVATGSYEVGDMEGGFEIKGFGVPQP